MAEKPRKRRRTGAGRKSLRDGERTLRATVNLPESVYEKAETLAGELSLSAYIRGLIDRDCKRRAG